MTSQKRLAFVAMPFADRFKPLYQDAIAAAGSDAHLELVRLQRLPVENIARQMKTNIDRCDFIIGVVTERNPHVFLEMGLAYAAQKPGVALAERGSDFEIFRGVFSCIAYGNDMVKFRRQLSDELQRLNT